MLEEADKSLALINEPPYNELPRVRVLFDDMEKAGKLCEALGPGRIVLSHNDCKQKNLIWSSKEGLSFIDFGEGQRRF